ncbi:MAG: DUF2156 domain-containing protein [Candidatus Eisenbacteria bacterium]|nr:DUF2156 domain-containing protein [Candidatus Eisenbacteria bacterium]
MPMSPNRDLVARPRTAAAPLVAAVTVVCALANLAASLPRLSPRADALREWLPLEVAGGSRLLGAVAALFLLLLARGLARRKRAAWQFSLVLLALSALAHPFRGRYEEVALLSVAMVAALLFLRREFWVKSDPVSLAGGWAVMGLGAVLSFAYTAAGYHLLRKHFAHVTDFPAAAAAALSLLTSFQTGAAFPLNREAAAFVASACTLEAAALFTGLFMLLAPFLDRRRQESERPRVEPVLRGMGRSSTSYFALEGDMRYHFLRSVPGVVAFTWRSGAALVAGEPLCEERHLAAAATEFDAHCQEHGWTPAFYQVGLEARTGLLSAGFSWLKIGEEAWFDLGSYSLDGPRRARLRHGVKRAEREGVTVVEHVPGLPGGAEREVRMEELSGRWLRLHGGREMGYLLGGLSLRAPRDRRYFVAETRGRVAGLVTFVPVIALALIRVHEPRSLLARFLGAGSRRRPGSAAPAGAGPGTASGAAP